MSERESEGREGTSGGSGGARWEENKAHIPSECTHATQAVIRCPSTTSPYPHLSVTKSPHLRSQVCLLALLHSCTHSLTHSLTLTHSSSLSLMAISYAFSSRVVLGAGLALFLARHGLKRNSLSASGAAAAFLVGFLSFLTSIRFGAVLILFYYSSSKLTKVNEAKKASLEQDFKKVSGSPESYMHTCVLANDNR